MLRKLYRPLNVWYRKSITNVHVQQNEAHAKHLRICTCSEYVYKEKYMIPLAHLSSMLSNEICYAYIQHLHRKAVLLQARLLRRCVKKSLAQRFMKKSRLECKRWKNCTLKSFLSHHTWYVTDSALRVILHRRLKHKISGF